MQEFIKPSLDYIEQNLKTDITTDELANMTGYSITHYRRIFIQITGLSVAKYIAKKRINHALAEISSGRKAIDTVLEYGFDDYSGFYKAFVKMYGCSPMKYLIGYKNLTPKESENIFMDYKFTEQQKEKIINHGGNGFYLQILQALEVFPEKWKLSELNCNDENYFQSIIFFCKSEQYGDCVLKLYDADEIEVEYNFLREYNGGNYVKAFEYDTVDKTVGAILLERVYPGERLSNEPSLEKRLAVFSELFNAGRIEPKKPENYGSYTDWVINTANDIINDHKDNKELCAHALKAKELYLEIASVYDKKQLINKNSWSGNIISCGNGKYKMIDFKYYVSIGDPVFETGNFIFTESCFRNEPENTETASDYLEKSLNIPNKILRQCFYITTVAHGNIDGILLAESLMNKR
jgi:AraC-like DNA-binding protein